MKLLAIMLVGVLFLSGCGLIPGFNVQDVRDQTNALALELEGINTDMTAIIGELKRVTEAIKTAQAEGNAELLASLIEEGQALALLYEQRKGVADKLVGAYRLSADELKKAESTADYMEAILAMLLGTGLGFLGMKMPVARRDDALRTTASNVERLMPEEMFSEFKALQRSTLTAAAASVLKRQL